MSENTATEEIGKGMDKIETSLFLQSRGERIVSKSVQVGALIGGILGFLAPSAQDYTGKYILMLMGTVVGTVLGALIGSLVCAKRREEDKDDE